MSAPEVTEVLRKRIENQNRNDGRPMPAQAAAAADDLRDLIKTRLQEESPYSMLWRSFLAEPEPNAAELSGALEALFEADPALARRAGALLETYWQGTEPLQTDGTQTTSGDVTAEDKMVADPTPPGERDLSGDFSEGAYLYGDVFDSMVAVEPGPADESRHPQRLQASAPTPIESADLPDLFDRVQEAVAGHGDLDKAAKIEVATELDELLHDLTSPDAPLRNLIQARLVRIRRLAPGIFALLSASVDELNRRLGESSG